MTEEEQIKRAALLFGKLEEVVDYLYPEKDTDPILADVIWDAKNAFIKVFENLEEKKEQYKEEIENERINQEKFAQKFSFPLDF